VNAFVIRPFGKKDVVTVPAAPPADPLHPGQERNATAKVVQIDFQDVHDRLVAPALKQLRIEAETTEAILSSGNIREDMFHRLMTADLVLADVSMHNANVFYELGIRHAFRDKFTFLIRSNLSEYPFDLKTDRYFEYDHTKLDAKSVEALAKAIRMTLNSERSDSPVFRLLPRMRAEDRSRFIAVPREFKEELDRAKKYRRGGDLRLLGAECEGFLWEVEGLREVGRAQFELNFIPGACATFEEIVRRYPDDVEANMVLSTVYQRRKDTARSEQALARVARLNVGDANTAAEIQSLVGRNLRARWHADWAVDHDKNPREQRDFKVSPGQQRRALCSPFLRRAYEAYSASFRGNLNFVYSGLNALALLLIELSLGARFEDEWRVMCPGEGDVERRREEAERLTAVLSYSIECERIRLEQERGIDFWFYSLRATFLALTCADAARVEQAYREAAAYAPKYTEESMRRGLDMYRSLDVEHFNPAVRIQENVARALKVIREEEGPRTACHVLLFAGLRLAPHQHHVPAGAAPPEDDGIMRHLPDEALAWANEKIRAVVEQESRKLQERAERRGGDGREHFLLAMAGGCSGPDLLFHEACLELGIRNRMYLALPKDQYVGKYVAEAGPEWVERFNDVYRRVQTGRTVNGMENGSDLEYPVHVLSDADELPRWLQSLENYSIGRRTEVWMLQHALVQKAIFGPDTEVTLVVLWSPAKALSGGLHHLVDLARRSGVKVLTIDCGHWEPVPAGRAEAATAS